MQTTVFGPNTVWGAAASLEGGLSVELSVSSQRYSHVQMNTNLCIYSKHSFVTNEHGTLDYSPLPVIRWQLKCVMIK